MGIFEFMFSGLFLFFVFYVGVMFYMIFSDDVDDLIVPSISTIVFLGVLYFYFDMNIFYFVINNPFMFLGSIGLYLVFGTVYSFRKWQKYLKKSSEVKGVFENINTLWKYNNVINMKGSKNNVQSDFSSLKDLKTYIIENQDKIDDSRYKFPTALENKSMLFSFILYWVLYIIIDILENLVIRLFQNIGKIVKKVINYIIDNFIGVYNKITMNAIKNCENEMKDK